MVLGLVNEFNFRFCFFWCSTLNQLCICPKALRFWVELIIAILSCPGHHCWPNHLHISLWALLVIFFCFLLLGGELYLHTHTLCIGMEIILKKGLHFQLFQEYFGSTSGTVSCSYVSNSMPSMHEMDKCRPLKHNAKLM